VVLKELRRELSRSDLCGLEENKHIGLGGSFGYAVMPSQDRCAELCADSAVNYCEFPAATSGQWVEIYGYGRGTDAGADAGICPFADAVGAQTLTCRQQETRGKWSSGCPVEGRRPEGYVARGAFEAASSIVGEYLAGCAHLEAASVVAFEDLASELSAHGAPEDLVQACLAAATEEVAHAAAVGALAREHGGVVAPVDLPSRRSEPRALVDIAIDNAVEGCVRELFGAVQAHARAARAADAGVRAVMTRIAEDESRHAELSARIREFLHSRLDASSRDRVRKAAQAARVELRSELARDETHPTLARVAGVPTREVALALFDALGREVWQAAQAA
jgi:hypothetical protein